MSRGTILTKEKEILAYYYYKKQKKIATLALLKKKRRKEQIQNGHQQSFGEFIMGLQSEYITVMNWLANLLQIAIPLKTREKPFQEESLSKGGS